MGRMLESFLRTIFLQGNTNNDVWQVMHSESTMFSVLIVVVVGIALGYALLYHVIDSASYNKRKHLWMVMSVTASVVFAFTLWYVPFSVKSGIASMQETSANPLESGFTQPLTLAYGVMNAIPIGLAAMFWTMVLFGLLTLSPFPRGRSINCRTLKVF